MLIQRGEPLPRLWREPYRALAATFEPCGEGRYRVTLSRRYARCRHCGLAVDRRALGRHLRRRPIELYGPSPCGEAAFRFWLLRRRGINTDSYLFIREGAAPHCLLCRAPMRCVSPSRAVIACYNCGVEHNVADLDDFGGMEGYQRFSPVREGTQVRLERKDVA